jgi:hypothetical protein
MLEYVTYEEKPFILRMVPTQYLARMFLSKLTRKWSDPTGRNLPSFFFTARVYTKKSTVKILAANTHCKYFLKMRNRLYQRFGQPFVALTTAMYLSTD